MQFADIVPWLAVAISFIALILSRTDKGADATAQMQIDIAKIKTMLESMAENHGTTEKRQEENIKTLQARNSESHAKIHAKIDDVTERVTDLEHKVSLYHNGKEG